MLKVFLFLQKSPKGQKALEARNGTDMDKATLAATFSVYGFEVIEKDDLQKAEIFAEIKKLVQKMDNLDSLFVCILSHGFDG